LAWIVAPESLAPKRDHETLAAVTFVVGRVFRRPEFEAPDIYLLESFESGRSTPSRRTLLEIAQQGTAPRQFFEAAGGYLKTRALLLSGSLLRQ
jgi:hypothetical protein